MKSLILAVVVMAVSMSFAFANSESKGNQAEPDQIKIIREWK